LIPEYVEFQRQFLFSNKKIVTMFFTDKLIMYQWKLLPYLWINSAYWKCKTVSIYQMCLCGPTCHLFFKSKYLWFIYRWD